PDLPAERAARGPHAAHPVAPAAGRGGRGAQVDAAGRRRIGIEPGDGTGEQLAHVLDSGVDVTPDVIRVLVVKVGGQADEACRDEATDPGREALDLALDPV